MSSALSEAEDYLKIFRAIGKDAVEHLASEDSWELRESVGKNPLGQPTLRADRDLETLSYKRLEAEGFEGRLITEERGELKIGETSGGVVIVLDPLDGSTNFKRGLPIYCLGIAASRGEAYRDIFCSYVINLHSAEEYWYLEGKGSFKGGKPIATSHISKLRGCGVDLGGIKSEAVQKALLPLASRFKDLRLMGSALLAACWVAEGVLEVAAELRGISAIHAMGLKIAEGAGGVVWSPTGAFNPKLKLKERIRYLCCSNQAVLDEFLRSLKLEHRLQDDAARGYVH